jgi:hypothetical protein
MDTYYTLEQVNFTLNAVIPGASSSLRYGRLVGFISFVLPQAEKLVEAY